MSLKRSPEISDLNSVYAKHVKLTSGDIPQQLMQTLQRGECVFDTLFVDRLVDACEISGSFRIITKLLHCIAGGDTYNTGEEYDTPEHKHKIVTAICYLVPLWMVGCKSEDAVDILPELFVFIDAPIEKVLTMYGSTYSFTQLSRGDFYNLCDRTLLMGGWYCDLPNTHKVHIRENVLNSISQLTCTDKARGIVTEVLSQLLKY